MTILGHLPYIIQAILAFIIGTLFFIQVFKVNTYNRLGVSSAVIYMYGVSVTVLLAHYELDGSIIILMLKWIHVISLTLFIFGIIVSYRFGPKEQKIKWHKTLKEIGKLFIAGAIIVSILIFFGEVWDL